MSHPRFGLAGRVATVSRAGNERPATVRPARLPRPVPGSRALDRRDTFGAGVAA